MNDIRIDTYGIGYKVHKAMRREERINKAMDIIPAVLVVIGFFATCILWAAEII